MKSKILPAWPELCSKCASVPGLRAPTPGIGFLPHYKWDLFITLTFVRVHKKSARWWRQPRLYTFNIMLPVCVLKVHRQTSPGFRLKVLTDGFLMKKGARYIIARGHCRAMLVSWGEKLDPESIACLGLVWIMIVQHISWRRYLVGKTATAVRRGLASTGLGELCGGALVVSR